MMQTLEDLINQAAESLSKAAELLRKQEAIPEKVIRRRWSKRSLENLKGVDKELVNIAWDVLQVSPLDFVVIEGLRTEARQAKLVKRGASQTMRSYHLIGRAIDFVPLVDGEISWHWEDFNKIGPCWESTAKDRGSIVTWGGRWKKFPDGAHVQLEPYATPRI